MPELLLQADIARIFVILSLGGTFRRILIGSILWHSMTSPNNLTNPLYLWSFLMNIDVK